MSIWELLTGNWQLAISRMGGCAMLLRDNGGIPTLVFLKSGKPDCASRYATWLDLKELRSRGICGLHDRLLPRPDDH
jgi:hypothetical protein